VIGLVIAVLVIVACAVLAVVIPCGGSWLARLWSETRGPDFRERRRKGSGRSE